MESSPHIFEPNIMHGLVIGCEQYTDNGTLGSKFERPISKSYEDVKKYKEFLQNQGFDEVIQITD
jgi:hypothetical protein